MQLIDLCILRTTTDSLTIASLTAFSTEILDSRASWSKLRSNLRDNPEEQSG